jgi:hypothetical protein
LQVLQASGGSLAQQEKLWQVQKTATHWHNKLASAVKEARALVDSAKRAAASTVAVAIQRAAMFRHQHAVLFTVSYAVAASPKVAIFNSSSSLGSDSAKHDAKQEVQSKKDRN